jgi:pyruvate formate lyase activating enzyme
VLDNARRLAAAGITLWIRTPVITGYTDDAENIEGIAGVIRDVLPTVERWDLLAYTNLGRPKYHRLDKPYALEKTPLVTTGTMEGLWRRAAEIAPVAHWTGATRQGDA